MNSPTRKWENTRSIEVKGWLLPRVGIEVKGMRFANNGKYYPLQYGEDRHDVAKAYPDRGYEAALHTGFYEQFEFEDGRFSIEADFGEGWHELYSDIIHYSSEDLVEMVFNPNLANNMAEHINLMQNKSKYYSESPLPKEFERSESDPRIVAFYLPQYHPIKENDMTWGKGFTEWTNVTAAQPRFIGHRQPLLPGDLGFYDLRLDEVIHEQITLAKKNGIYGFCFYYYWFSGKKILNRPIEAFLSHKDWDFNFMIAWANENWTKRWDGLDDDVIIAQKYLKEDPLNFIKDVEDILLDPRYIRQNGKPVLTVYRGSQLKEPEEYIKVWRAYFKEKHGLELEILSVLGFEAGDPRPIGFDKGIEFEPLTVAKRSDFNQLTPKPVNPYERLIDVNFSGNVLDYRQIALDSRKYDYFNFPTYKSIITAWDNDARKKGNGATITYASNPDIFAVWLQKVISEERKKYSSPLIFINAWNEWAEGTVLEPTRDYGHAVLNRVSQVMSLNSDNNSNREELPLFGVRKRPQVDIAIVVHIFFDEEWKTIRNKLKSIDSNLYDLYITITGNTEHLIKSIEADFPKAQIKVVPNRGRDILPFVFLLPQLTLLGYKYALKLHTKRSVHRKDGKKWLNELLDKLIPTSDDGILSIAKAMDEGVGIVGPADHFVSLDAYIGSNEVHLKRILTDGFGEDQYDLSLLRAKGYFAGSMFWVNLEALKPITEQMLTVEDFESERGQIDGTMAHALERAFTLSMYIANYKVSKISAQGIQLVSESDIDSDYEYAK